MLGNRVPASVKIFLTALAIVDDLGAIVVIAIFYTEKLETTYLLLSALIMLILIVLNYLKVKKHIFYIIPGIFLWYCMHHSGIHATIAGVLLAFTIPLKQKNETDTNNAPLVKLEHALHNFSAFLIMPLFALANAGVIIDFSSVIEHKQIVLGVALGLVIGKPIGIFLFTYLANSLKIATKPTNVTWSEIVAVGFLGGIGFTMSIFISHLAFNDPSIVSAVKIGIFASSITAAIIGVILILSNKKRV